jgi:polyisoprenoid-binding protein YceI
MKAFVLVSTALVAGVGTPSLQPPVKATPKAPAKSAAKPAAKTSSSSAPAAGRLRYVVAPNGNEARYRVREQLVGRDLQNDAIGTTTDITGRLIVDPNGTVVRDSSTIVVQVASLKSDQSRRDAFLRRRTLETEKYPSVSLSPRTFEGISSPIAPGASATFSLVGDLTIHGVTRPTTWHVTARSDGPAVVGTATTAFTFKDFNLDQPKVPIVLSVADTLKLEYDFRFVPDTTGK